MPTTAAPVAGTNLSVLVGTLSRSPEHRSLPSGDHVIVLEITVRPSDAPAESVPVAWPNGPSRALRWAVATEVLVIGRVRRRFFRAGGITQSRTEVVAHAAVPTRQAVTAQRALRTALAELMAPRG